MTFESIPYRAIRQAELRPTAPAYYVRNAAGWHMSTWRTYADEMKLAARALMHLGLEVGGSVCMLGFNSPEWTTFDVACMAAGGAPAGIYTTCSPTEVAYILNHAQAVACLIEDADQWAKLDAERDNLPHLKTIVAMKGCAEIVDDRVLSWDAFLALGANTPESELQARLDDLQPDQLATLIYTSGTTGPPKGVMLSHGNLSWTATAARDMIDGNPSDTALSYLPLSHIAEQMFSIHGPATIGYAVYYAQSMEKLPDNLKEVQPSVFFGVPRIWEKFHAGISGKMKLATGPKAALIKWARGVGKQVSALRMQGMEPAGFLGLQYGLANRLIFSKLKPVVGLANAKVCISGAAPIASEVLQFFAELDIIVLEVYGQSEDCGPTTFNLPGRALFGTVGPPVEGVEVRIADDGEICVRGPNVFLGYYKDQEATDEALIDGWLHSGDLGSFDAAGFLTITGRKKDIIITAGGKNVTPKNIESALKNCEIVNEAVVIGDRRKFLSALVTLDPDATPVWCEANGADAANAVTDPKVRALIQAHIDEMNKEFARVEQIKKFTILSRNLSIEDGELTPTLKVKRRIVNDNFATEIEAIYDV